MLDKWKIIRMVIQSPNLENIPQRPCFKKKLFATWKSKMVAIFQDGRKRGYILAYDLTQMFSVTDHQISRCLPLQYRIFHLSAVLHILMLQKMLIIFALYMLFITQETMSPFLNNPELLCFHLWKPLVSQAFCFPVCPAVSESACPKTLWTLYHRNQWRKFNIILVTDVFEFVEVLIRFWGQRVTVGSYLKNRVNTIFFNCWS